MDVAGGHAVEFFEDMFLVFFLDADAVVGHFQDGVGIFPVGADDDVQPVGRVFDGVVEQVVDHVGDMQPVGIEDSRERL